MKLNPRTSKVLAGSAYVAAFLAMAVGAHAQKLGIPGGWKAFDPTTDNFNRIALGSKWVAVAKNEDNKTKTGQTGFSRFRTQNVQMNNAVLGIVNWYHSTPITEGGITTNYSGGWCRSSIGYLTEGQFQTRQKVSFQFADVWPTFWTNRGGGDELDIMEYQTDILNQTHHVHAGGTKSSPRLWPPWINQGGEWTWAMARVTSWTHWAARTTRTSKAQFFINAKLEHTSNLRNVISGMEMLFTSSPHKNHLPGPGSYPRMEIDWVETHVP